LEHILILSLFFLSRLKLLVNKLYNGKNAYEKIGEIATGNPWKIRERGLKKSPWKYSRRSCS